MIKRLIKFFKTLLTPSYVKRIVILEAQAALLTLQVLKLERQQIINLQTINDLVKFENDILKVIDYAGDFASSFDKQGELLLYSLVDDDEFMN